MDVGSYGQAGLRKVKDILLIEDLRNFRVYLRTDLEYWKSRSVDSF